MENTKSTKNTHKVIIIVLFNLIIIFSLILYFGYIRSPSAINISGTYIKNPIEIKDLHFADHQGNAFTKKNLEGHWSMVFFGFTHCKMVCPTTMNELNTMYKLLQHDLPNEQLPHIIFVSVDPDRDTLENLTKFINSFNSRFIGITADIAETIKLEKQLHITVSNSNTISHSMEILLLNPNARVQAYFSFPHSAEKLAADYKTILTSQKKSNV